MVCWCTIDEKPAAKAPGKEPATGCETILLVDDEEDVLSVTGQMLGKLGYEVLSAPNGRTAVQLFEESGDSIDLVILSSYHIGYAGRWPCIGYPLADS